MIRAALVFVALIALYAFAGRRDFEDAQITEQMVAEATAKKSMHPCDGATMKQWGAGERWHPKGEEQEPECVARAKKLPDYVLTMPLGEAK